MSGGIPRLNIHDAEYAGLKQEAAWDANADGEGSVPIPAGYARTTSPAGIAALNRKPMSGGLPSLGLSDGSLTPAEQLRRRRALEQMNMTPEEADAARLQGMSESTAATLRERGVGGAVGDALLSAFFFVPPEALRNSQKLPNYDADRTGYSDEPGISSDERITRARKEMHQAADAAGVQVATPVDSLSASQQGREAAKVLQWRRRQGSALAGNAGQNDFEVW